MVQTYVPSSRSIQLENVRCRRQRRRAVMLRQHERKNYLKYQRRTHYKYIAINDSNYQHINNHEGSRTLP